MKEDKNIFERNPKRTILIAIVVLTLILDVSVTKVFTFIKEQKKEQMRVEARRGIARITAKHEVYHHAFKENSFTEASFRDRKYYVYTNSLGFKDKSSRAVSISSDKKRIVFIGDSFTEGVSLRYEDTFVGMIDTELKEKGIEVLNAGRSSYSSLIYYKKIKYLIEEVGLKFDELVVFEDLSDGYNDIFWYILDKEGDVTHSDDLYLGHWNEPDPRNSPVKRGIDKFNYKVRSNTTLLYPVFNTLYRLFKLGGLVTENKAELRTEQRKVEEPDKVIGAGSYSTVLRGIAGIWTIDKKVYHEWGHKGVEIEKKYMDKLLELVRRNNIKLTVAVYPWPTQVWYEDLDSIQVREWREWSHNNHVKLINYFPDFVVPGLSQEERLSLLEKYYIPGDPHWNERGHRKIANKFLEEYFNDNQ